MNAAVGYWSGLYSEADARVETPPQGEVPVDRDLTAAPAQDSLLGRRYYYVAGDRL